MSDRRYRRGQAIVTTAVLIGCLHVAAALAAGVELSVTDNLLAWFRADAGVTESGGTVTAWSDQAATLGGANDAVQATLEKQPRLVANGSPLGNLPVVRFDGSDYLHIEANEAFDATTLSWFAVYTAAAQESGTQRVFETSDTSYTGGFWGNSVYVSSEGVRPHAVYARNAALHYKPLVSGAVPVEDFVMTSAVLNGTSEEVNGNAATKLYAWLNGTAMPSSPLSGMDITPQGNLGSRIGARADAESHFLTGDIAEILIYDTALSETDRQAVEQYLTQKWFQSSSLDGDLNSDGFVGGDDLDIVRSYWGQNVPSGNLLQGDPSDDGFVGGDDLDIVRANWGQGTPPAPTGVPEPTALVLFGTGLLGWMVLRRR